MPEVAPSRLRRDLKASMVDGAAYGLMVGIGETYLPAFALAYGLGEISAGLLAALPMFAGGILQLAAPLGLAKLGSYRRWNAGAATVQALVFVPLALAAAFHVLPPSGIFLLAAAYWGAGMAAGPAWNAWVVTLFPARLRARYFARRSRRAQLAVLTGLLGGGAILQAASETHRPLYGFLAAFVVAGLARTVSAWSLTRHSEPEPPDRAPPSMSWRSLLADLKRAADERILLYLVLMQAAVQLSAPYFTPFMLHELALPYGLYMPLISVSFVTKIVAYPLLGRLAHRAGPRRLLAFGGVAVVPLAALWLPSHDYVYLLVVQCFAGVAWGAFELGSFLMLFEAIEDRERTRILTIYNVALAGATVGGAAIGGVILGAFGADPLGYSVLFGLSSLLRAVLLLGVSKLPIMSLTQLTEVITRTDAVRPSAGSLERPVVASFPSGRTDSHARRATNPPKAK